MLGPHNFFLVRAEGPEPNGVRRRMSLVVQVYAAALTVLHVIGIRVSVAALPISAGDSGLTCRGKCP